MDGLKSQSAGRTTFLSGGFLSFAAFILEVSHFPMPGVPSLSTRSEIPHLSDFVPLAQLGKALL